MDLNGFIKKQEFYGTNIPSKTFIEGYDHIRSISQNQLEAL